MLRDAVKAFEQVDFSEMNNLEAAEFVADRPLDEDHWKKMLDYASRVGIFSNCGRDSLPSVSQSSPSVP